MLARPQMKLIGLRSGLERLARIQDELRSQVAPYEQRAQSCVTCKTQGVCCLDAHFVNVHISRLEAEAIKNALAEMPSDLQDKVGRRIDATIEQYALTADGDTFSQKFACPLFERGIGCLVHSTAKPVPCIIHACYENEADLPPDEPQAAAERDIDTLNTRVYGRPQQWLPLPLAINNAGRRGDAK